ncbi:MAG: T9SS type A sorting domain-containing protein [Bacteroidia bacterium]|nr:T9SS type A sorting domain-containing protein [Bacteroidia bacterium]
MKQSFTPAGADYVLRTVLCALMLSIACLTNSIASENGKTRLIISENVSPLLVTTYYADVDGDGFGDPNNSIVSALPTPPPGYVVNSSDCNDASSAIYPGAPELCNNIDDNCNLSVDEGLPLTHYFLDADGDTWGAAMGSIFSCQPIAPPGYINRNNDCDDSNPAINPLATEVCNSVDDDCDGLIDEGVLLTFYQDFDGDLFGNTAVSALACTAPVGYVSNNNDCNDNDITINPSASEVCNSIDDDCDNFVDNGLPFYLFYQDADGDNFGNVSNFQVACSQPSGYVLSSSDCNDNNSLINPAAQEICDGGIDNDCDGLTDDADPSVQGQGTYYADADGDTYGAGAAIVACVQPVNTALTNDDCDDNNAAVNPGAQEVCNNVDDDCNGLTDDGLTFTTYYTDADGDNYGTGSGTSLCSNPGAGFSTVNGDCDDNNAAVNPAAQEVCNNVDDDCNGLTDDGLTFTTYYTDADGDNYGTGIGTSLCSNPGAGFSSVNGDCDDNNAAVNPAAQEVCNNVDDDCNGLTDDGLTFMTYYTDADGDNYGTGIGTSLCNNPGAGFSTVNGDCDDNNAAVNPAAQEVCNNVDDDCNGLTDDGLTFTTYYTDADGDNYGTGSGTSLCSNPGAGFSSVNGDCDDNNALINPAAQEICDGGIDNDCDGLTDDADPSVQGQGTYYADADGDTYGAGAAIVACVQPANTSLTNDDCDDNNAAVNPAAQEVCNNVDDDCNGLTDDGLTFTTYYTDADGDNYGTGSGTSLCSNPGAGFSSVNGDCDDNNAAVNPAAQEVCNNVDDDCNGLTDDGLVFTTYYTDADGDNYGTGIGTSLCNNPGAGFSTVNGDCDDNSASVNPAAQEVCNNVDDDCNGLTDDGLLFLNYYSDNDGDTYGALFIGNLCQHPGGNAVLIAGDCDDLDNQINPLALEVCNGVDDDCNGLTDDGLTFITYYEDFDTDGYGNSNVSQSTCNGAPANYVIDNTDCNDMDYFVNPAAAEVCNGIDDDCDGTIDGGTVLPLGGISGPAQVCIPVTNGSATFSVALVPGITNYTWTLPTGLTIVSGQGTNTINVSWTGAAAHDGIAGVMSVVGSNGCGGGAPVTVDVDMHYTVPVRPPSVSGMNRLCNGDASVYSVSLVARATSYTWSVPAGMTILSGQGTNIINVSVGAGFLGGSIDVYCSNVCGNGPVRSKTVAQNVLGLAGPISGQASGLCNATGIVYSTTGVVGANSYTWSVPFGATIVSGQGTNTISVDFSGSITTGSISVYGTNACGAGAFRSLTVIGHPNGPGPIVGSTTVCPSATNVKYEVTTVAGASSYTWVPPSGATIASGQGTKTVFVNYGPTSANNLSISLTATNACGTSGVRVLGGISVNNIYCGPRLGATDGKIKNVMAYPNPATERTIIRFSSEEGLKYKISMADMMGRIIFSEAGVTNGDATTKEINVSTMESGLYLLSLEREDEVHQIKIVVE